MWLSNDLNVIYNRYFWLIGTILLFLQIIAQQVDGKIYCILLADCHAKRGDILREKGNKKACDLYDTARHYIRKQEKYDACKVSSIDEYCKSRLDGCRAGYEIDTIDEIEDKLRVNYFDKFLMNLRGSIHNSYSSCQDYSIYFCRMNEPGYWPQDVYNSIKIKYNIGCRSTCWRFTSFHEYQLRIGRKFPEDFPTDWGKRLVQAKWIEILNGIAPKINEVELATKWLEFKDKWIRDCVLVESKLYSCWFEKSEIPRECLKSGAGSSTHGVEVDAQYVDDSNPVAIFYSVSNQIQKCSEDSCGASVGSNSEIVANCKYTRCVYQRLGNFSIVDRVCYECPCHHEDKSMKKGMLQNTPAPVDESLTLTLSRANNDVDIWCRWRSSFKFCGEGYNSVNESFELMPDKFEATDAPRVISITNNLYGVTLEGELPDQELPYIPLEDGKLKKTLQELRLNGRGSKTFCDYSDAPLHLFQRPNRTVISTYTSNFTLEAHNEARFYRIKIICNQYQVYTNMIYVSYGVPGQSGGDGELGFNINNPDWRRYRLERIMTYPTGRPSSSECFP